MGEKVLKEDKIIIDSKNNEITLKIDTSFYPLDIILSVSYLYTEDNYIYLDGDPASEVVVNISPKKAEADLKNIAMSFNNELINYAAYSKLLEKNKDLRKIILQRVLMTNSIPPPAKACINIEDAEIDIDIEDPEGIMTPWEEKYGDEEQNEH